MNKLGPYDLGRVYQGDCLELLKAIPDGSVPMIWTDPPYGNNNMDGDLAASRVGIHGARQAPAVPIQNDARDKYEPLLRTFLVDANRVLTPDCCCCCCCCGGGGPSPAFALLSLWIDDALRFFHAVVWDKSAAGNGLGWRYRRNYEFVMVAHRKQGRLAWNDDMPANPNIVRTSPARDRMHPNQKPVALVEHFLRLHTKPGDIVLDPFAGAGTTGVACANLGRQFLGFELDAHWCDVANQRIEAARQGLKPQELKTGQTTLFDMFSVKDGAR